MDETLIEAIEKTRKSIKKKYKDLQQWKSAERRSFERIYEPLITPIRQIGKKEKTIIKTEKDEEEESRGKNEQHDITIENSSPQKSNDSPPHETTFRKKDESGSPENDSFLFTDAQEESLKDYWLNQMIVSPNYDSTYGPKYDPHNLIWGNQSFDIRNEDSQIISGEYKSNATQGLLQLIFYKKPDRNIIQAEDINTYASFLNYNSAHRINSDPHQRINGNSGHKYMTYIQPYIDRRKKNESGGGNLKFFVSNKKTTYKYWDDPNELLKRLSLLVADKNAGNKTAHDVEIHSILTELNQKKYIKRIPKG